jgi:uncharacterized membrane protein SirB2
MFTECKQHNISSLIPQVFFDIIARVVPGFVMLSVYLIIYLHFDKYGEMLKEWFGPSNNKIPSSSPFLFFLLIVAYSYALGMLLWGIRYGIHWGLCRDKKFVVLETGIKLDNNLTRDQYRLDYCRIKKYEPMAGTRLTKIKAEIHMTMALTSGFAIACIVSLFVADITDDAERFLYSMLFLLVAVASEAAGMHFRRHMKKSIENIKEVCFVKNECDVRAILFCPNRGGNSASNEQVASGAVPRDCTGCRK